MWGRTLEGDKVSEKSLKFLNSNLTNLKLKGLGLLTQKTAIQEEIDKCQAAIIATEKEIYKLESIGPIVSEHAILRYLERIMNIDISEIKDKILDGGIYEQVKTLSSGHFVSANGFKVVSRNNVIVTVKGGEYK